MEPINEQREDHGPIQAPSFRVLKQASTGPHNPSVNSREPPSHVPSPQMQPDLKHSGERKSILLLNFSPHYFFFLESETFILKFSPTHTFPFQFGNRSKHLPHPLSNALFLRYIFRN